MRKILHLVCNSHIDPVWQWDWDEGISATLSTFYAACNMLDKYDFIFCHNEAILYEYIERYDPVLFKRIEKLVQEGKWHIMGGWYIQPDCLVPSGESLIRQCTLGREYFGEKFHVRPTTALNLDSFGHTRGLPQILKKCGFDAYVFCRPLSVVHDMHEIDLPHGPFLWEGYDGSRVKALRYEDPDGNYTSVYGQAVPCIERKSNCYKDLDVRPILWGVGNHGGFSSEQDLEDIMILMDQKKGEYVIKHSTLENYFKECGEPTIVDNRQYIALTKSYSSVHPIKLVHDQLENALYFTEKICTIADLSNKYHCDKEILKNAERVLCQIAFHDVLSGTAIKIGTDSSIMKAHHAIDELKKEMLKAFFALSNDLPKVPQGDDGIVLFNPYPYDIDDYFETEIYPVDSCFDNQSFVFTVRDIGGKVIEHQMLKEDSLIFHQKRARLIYKVHIPAFSVTMVSVHNEVINEKKPFVDNGEEIIVSDSTKTVKISRKTGLISSFIVENKEYLSAPIGLPVLFSDGPDPWGWRIKSLTDTIYNENGWPIGEGKSSLKEFKLDNKGKGVFTGLKGVTVLGDGPVLTEVQSLYSLGESHVVVNYKIYKNKPSIDMNLHVLFNEHGKGLKLKFPLAGSKKYFAQMAFGVETYSDSKEYPCNRYVGVQNGENVFAIYNRSGIHSVSRKGRNLYLTLLNGSAYCAHPTRSYNPMLVDMNRYIPFIEQGAHDFSLRLQVNKLEECEKFANEFNQQVYSLTHFPHGDGKEINTDLIRLSNPNIVISALKRRNDGTYLIRLYNGLAKKSETDLQIMNKKMKVRFGKFEFKTFVFDGKTIEESKDSSIY